MIWYLIFCSGVSGGPVCTTTTMSSKEACLLVAKEMRVVAGRVYGLPASQSYKCVGVRK
jgi:hypothetical protein